jgi:hypothetical protein
MSACFSSRWAYRINSLQLSVQQQNWIEISVMRFSTTFKDALSEKGTLSFCKKTRQINPIKFTGFGALDR